MESKKVSFGFSKIGKKLNLQAGPAATGPVSVKGTTVEFIDCLEGQSIKIIGKDQEDDTPKPLVIPLREQDKTTIPGRLAKLLHIKEEKASTLSPKPNELERNGSIPVKQEPVEGETLEQRAAREILADLQQLKKEPTEVNAFVVPLKPEELPLEGARESTLDDYESIPVERFGMAMLRGMGFKEDPAAKKEDSKLPQEGPVQRPKGLGLGADRGMKSKPLLVPPAKDETLIMKRGAQVKVLAGKHKDAYGTKGVPNEIVLLDWQICRYVSPVLDLVYFLFCCTDAEFRRKYFDEMIGIYHHALRTLLEKLGHDAAVVFPMTALLRHLKQFGKFGLLMALFLVPMLCTRNEDLPDMDEMAEKFQDTQVPENPFAMNQASHKVYKVRMGGVIRDAVRYGYL